MTIKIALISVSDKAGIVDLGKDLTGLGYSILSTGGTLRALIEGGVRATSVSEHTGFPEILEGRVKTLHPKIHAGILAKRGDAGHVRKLAELEIDPIALVVVNLYPFEATVSRPDVSLSDAIEQIDIGGPTLLRAAAKNFRHVTAIVDPRDYSAIVAEMKSFGGQPSLETRQTLALKTFQHTARYDAAIADYLSDHEEGEGLASQLNLIGIKKADLRYGENPHQEAALYLTGSEGVASARQLHGKGLSYNNYLDLDGAWALVSEFPEMACAIIKHTNPSGVAQAPSQVQAYLRALECDPVSAFGSIIAFNREVEASTAEEVKSLFVEAIIAPSFEQRALEVLSAKKNLRLMEMDRLGSNATVFRQVSGGILVQGADDTLIPSESDLRVVTSRKPDAAGHRDLLFAFAVCKHVKSNAIVFARGERTLGIGAGQMSRVDSVRLAVEKAQSSLQGAVMASDAFFPFRDGIDTAAQNGIDAVIQPGGSRRDAEVIAAAEEHGMIMIFTGMRHFRH